MEMVRIRKDNGMNGGLENLIFWESWYPTKLMIEKFSLRLIWFDDFLYVIDTHIFYMFSMGEDWNSYYRINESENDFMENLCGQRIVFWYCKI